MKPLSDTKIVIIDYGMGNLVSVQNAFKRLGASPVISDQVSTVRQADALVLPGVGAFGEAMKNLHALKLPNLLEEMVLADKKPLLGICLGMQILFQSSTERGNNAGLGFLKGHVELMSLPSNLHLPHVGWNEIQIVREQTFFAGIENTSTFYFDHSYHVSCEDSLVSSRCSYGIDINASVRHENIIATQFHPEKSQNAGLRVLRGFLNFIAD